MLTSSWTCFILLSSQYVLWDRKRSFWCDLVQESAESSICTPQVCFRRCFASIPILLIGGNWSTRVNCVAKGRRCPIFWTTVWWHFRREGIYNQRHDLALSVIQLVSALQNDYKVLSDLAVPHNYFFPPYLATTNLCSDVVVYSKVKRRMWLSSNLPYHFRQTLLGTVKEDKQVPWDNRRKWG